MFESRAWLTSKHYARRFWQPLRIAPLFSGMIIEKMFAQGSISYLILYYIGREAEEASICSNSFFVCLASGRLTAPCAAFGHSSVVNHACPWTNSSWKCSNRPWDEVEKSYTFYWNKKKNPSLSRFFCAFCHNHGVIFFLSRYFLQKHTQNYCYYTYLVSLSLSDVYGAILEHTHSDALVLTCCVFLSFNNCKT